MRTVYVGNHKCFVGQNKRENWQLLEDKNPWDLIFHLTSFPSCYVVVPMTERDVLSEESILDIARVCKKNTKYRNLRDVKVDYTTISNISVGEDVGEYEYISNRKVKVVKV